MARRQKQARRRQGARQSTRAGRGKNRATEFLTVAWMLCVSTTVVCELAAAGGMAYVRARPEALRIAALSSVLLFAALVVGMFSLVLMAMVWRLRSQKLPIGVSVFAFVVGVLPAAAMLLQRLF